MKRCTFLPFLIATASACASQPICKPWSPDVAPPVAATIAPPTTPAPVAVDDGTTALAGPDADDSWSTVVGDRALPPPLRVSRSSRAPRSPRAKTVVALAQPAVATSPAPAADATERPMFGSPGYGLPVPARPAGAAKHVTRTAAVAPKPAPPAAAARPPAAAARPAPVVPAPAKTAAVEPPKPTPPKPVATEDKPTPEARAFFAGRCAMCHGDAGRGDGPAGKALTPQPRNFTDRGWQTSVTDQHIEKVILNGGPSVGKSPLMPAHGDLANNPALLKGMRALVRELGR